MQKLSSLGFAIVLFCLCSCQKELSVSLDQPLQGSQNSVPAPGFKTIKIQSSDFNDPAGYTYAPQYDSVNRKLNIYQDDPATPGTIYDVLDYVYEFNTDGYLVKESYLDDNLVMQTGYEILRNPANEIQMFIEHDVYDSYPGIEKDTLVFSYQNSGGQLVVMESLASGNYFDHSGDTMKFNSNYQLVNLRKNLGTRLDVENYFYDPQGNLTDMKGTFDTINYVYDSHPVAPEWKGNEGYFLGKDAWLLKHLDPVFDRIHFLTFLYGDFFEEWHNLLFTHPMSGYRAHGMGGPFLTDYADDQVNFTNTYTAGNLPLTMASSGPNGSSITFTFTYN